MEHEQLRMAMVILAVVTPLVAGALMIVGWYTRQMTGEAMPVEWRWRALVLGLAGPLNLLVWWLVNGWLDRDGPAPAGGMLLAAALMATAGLAIGYFARSALRGRRALAKHPPDDRPE